MSVRLRTLFVPLLLSLACESDPAPETKAEPKVEATSEKPASEKPASEKSASEKPASEELPAGNTKRIDIAAAAPPTVTLLEAGSNPEPMRLSPVAGATESMKMTMQMDMQMGPGTPKVEMPPMITTMSSVVDAVSKGSIKATVKFESMTVEADESTPPALIENLKATLDGFKSFRSSIELDERGALLGGTIDAPQGLPAPLQQTMNQMQESFGKLQVPLPEEAVGVGGKWKAVSDVEQGGMKIEQTATYEILSRDGKSVNLKVNLTQKIVEPEFSPPGMPGVKGTIERYKGGGDGTLQLELDKLTPTQSHMAMNVDMKMSVDMMGQSQVQELVMKVDVDLERAG